MQAGRRSHIHSARSRAVLRACALTIASLLAAPAFAAGARPPATTPALESATLEQCVTSVVQSERSATFSGEMTAVPGALRMAMRIEVQAQVRAATGFHLVNAPAWRFSDPKIKIYKYLKQVTNLSSPLEYRALVRFRWLGAKGRVIKRAQLLTAPCVQPAAPAQPPA
ncbi:MAG TPA: hypothetical protein VGX51_07435 [Solirubrobacteraceae bacterium]|nr:hypothetical protein [Solirubrobacteraceae bacterium]